MKKLIRFFKDDEGATMVEYGIMVALIAAVCIGIVTTLGTTVQGVFQDITTAISG
jgi:pilus assembly protein Flp/PilA